MAERKAVKITNYIFGITLGLFLGILILGTAIRIILAFIFGWQDSAPYWGIWLWLEAGLIIITTILTTYLATKWCIKEREPDPD